MVLWVAKVLSVPKMKLGIFFCFGSECKLKWRNETLSLWLGCNWSYSKFCWFCKTGFVFKLLFQIIIMEVGNGGTIITWLVSYTIVVIFHWTMREGRYTPPSSWFPLRNKETPTGEACSVFVWSIIKCMPWCTWSQLWQSTQIWFIAVTSWNLV